jgi:hypothetical protein
MNAGGVDVLPPIEEEALFNPPFLALLANKAAGDFERRGGRGMPVLLTYLTAALVLHQPTRIALPSQVTSQMGEWIRSHPVLLLDLSERTRALLPFVSAGLRFGLRYGMLRSEGELLLAGRLRRRPRGMQRSDEVDNSLTKASLLGRWF